MSLLNKIRVLLWLFVIIAAGTAYLDYTRLEKGEQPLFCKNSYDEKNKIETFRGIFYVAERKVKLDPQEAINVSSNITYRFLNQTLKIKVQRPRDEYDFTLLVTPALACPSPSKLIYELEDRKIYLDCIASIKVKEKDKKESVLLNEDLEKNSSRIEDILQNLSFVGIYKDKSTEVFKAKDDTFSNKKIIVYKCHKNGVKDIYITLNPVMENDYCTLKNDSLKPKEEEKPVEG